MNVTRKHRYTAGAVLLLILVLIPVLLSHQRASNAGSAALYFGISPTKLYIGQNFPLEVRLRATDTPTDAIGLVMNYNSRAFDVLGMSTDHSFCTFYTENSFDTIHGEIHLSCGVPHPGFSGDSTLFTLQMRSKMIGNQTFQFDKTQTQILADDGKGTLLRLTPPVLTVPVVPST